jgi:hypothetical protein
MRKKILVFTPSFPFKNIHFHKDVMIIPKIISREYQMDTYVMTKKNESTYNSNESTHMIFSNSVFKNIWNFLKIKPDVVFTIHVARYTIFYVIIFKLLRKSTKIYLKID